MIFCVSLLSILGCDKEESEERKIIDVENYPLKVPIMGIDDYLCRRIE